MVCNIKKLHVVNFFGYEKGENPMFSSKRLNGTSSITPALVAGAGISIVSNQIHVDDSYVATDTQLSEATSTLVTQGQLTETLGTFVTQANFDTAATSLATKVYVGEAVSTFVTQNEVDTTIAEATTALVTEEELISATSASAKLVANNQYTGTNVFRGRTIFMDRVSLGSTADITDNENDVFRELRLLRSHYTAPVWINIALNPTNFIQNDYYPDGPQYCVIQYGTASHVSIRGVISENNNYFTDTDSRLIFVMPLGVRPAARHMFLQPGGNNGQAGAFLINHDGNVIYLAGNSLVKEENTTASFHLDGMNYWTN
jgi:hypothetical protein